MRKAVGGVADATVEKRQESVIGGIGAVVFAGCREEVSVQVDIIFVGSRSVRESPWIDGMHKNYFDAPRHRTGFVIGKPFADDRGTAIPLRAMRTGYDKGRPGRIRVTQYGDIAGEKFAVLAGQIVTAIDVKPCPRCLRRLKESGACIGEA